MNKALALICLILMSTSVSIAETVPLPPVPTDEERVPNFKLTELVEVEAEFAGLDDVDPNSAGLDFLKGFAHGLSPNHYAEMQQCIHDISPETFKRIENNIKKLNWKHIKQSVEAIADIAKVFLSVVKDCKSASKAVADIINKLTHALSGATFIEAAIRIITNPIKFAQVIKHIVDGFKKKDFYKAGDGVGEFVGRVLKLRTPSVEALLKEDFE